jgi:four helix bundle protein
MADVNGTWTWDSGLGTPDLGLRTWDPGLGTPDLGLGIPDLGLRTWDVGLFCYSGRRDEHESWGMRDYQKLEVWQLGRKLVRSVYKLTIAFPPSEMYGLTVQARRAAVGILSNIAEGSGRGSQADFARFIDMAIGSTCELETLGILAEDLGYLDSTAAAALNADIVRLRRMLVRLAQRLRRSPE